MAKICPRGGGIPGGDFSQSPDVATVYTDQRLVKFDYPARPVRATVKVPKAVNLVFLLKEDGCPCLTETGVLIIV